MTRNNFTEGLNNLRELRLGGAPLSLYREKYGEFTDGSDLSDLFYAAVRNNIRSTVSTPREISRNIALSIENPGKVLDAGCGTGNLTMELLSTHGKDTDITCLDEDTEALKVLEERAYFNGYENVKTVKGNFLDFKGKFDTIISNPPYSGHKDLEKKLRESMRKKYPLVYKNKGDLYYTFFPKAYELLNEGGVLSFVVSRYFLEAESAGGLREFILRNFRILYMYDYYGERPFSQGIDPLIITLKKEKAPDNYTFPAVRGSMSFTSEKKYLGKFSMTPITSEEYNLKEAIGRRTLLTLDGAGSFHQGIITGYDGAFVLKKDPEGNYPVEEDLLVPWIKNSYLKYGRGQEESCLIYPPADISGYPKFMEYIENFRERLSSRREVLNNKRKWYELQWGRKKELFMGERIIFPYKGEKARFKVGENVFHSADIYSYTTDIIPYPVLEYLLNSDIYDKYIKLHLKKLGRDLYDYYPSRLGKVRIPLVYTIPDAELFLNEIRNETGFGKKDDFSNDTDTYFSNDTGTYTDQRLDEV